MWNKHIISQTFVNRLLWMDPKYYLTVDYESHRTIRALKWTIAYFIAN